MLNAFCYNFLPGREAVADLVAALFGVPGAVVVVAVVNFRVCWLVAAWIVAVTVGVAVVLAVVAEAVCYELMAALRFGL